MTWRGFRKRTLSGARFPRTAVVETTFPETPYTGSAVSDKSSSETARKWSISNLGSLRELEIMGDWDVCTHNKQEQEKPPSHWRGLWCVRTTGAG